MRITTIIFLLFIIRAVLISSLNAQFKKIITLKIKDVQLILKKDKNFFKVLEITIKIS